VTCDDQHLGLLLRLDPDAARERILRAVERADGVVVDVALAFGVDARTAGRWIQRAGLRELAGRLRDERGYARLGREGRRGCRAGERESIPVPSPDA